MKTLNKRLFIVFISFILLVFVISGWFLYKYKQVNKAGISIHQSQELNKEARSVSQKEQTQQSTATTTVATSTLKIYRNEEFGFEFRYPDNWEIQANTFKSPFSKFNLVAHPTNTHPNFEPFGINITDADYAERSYQSLESKATSTTVDGVIATKYEYVAEAYNIDVIVSIGGNMILIGNENKEYLSEFNQILATFKFLK
ncbi:hypothetical protein HZB05_01430 [Candidatus Wolfebacteria bacterium]|nr:hypothetical protein [Candidatus Wolfebacteria bacterium]